jgi:hypothetical protein
MSGREREGVLALMDHPTNPINQIFNQFDHPTGELLTYIRFFLSVIRFSVSCALRFALRSLGLRLRLCLRLRMASVG